MRTPCCTVVMLIFLQNLRDTLIPTTVVPVSSFASTRWIVGPMQTTRYNGYPAMRLAGDAAPGQSTGQAMAEMEALAARLPAGFGFEWTGQSREEKLSGAQALLLLGFSMLAVFCACPRCTRAGPSRLRCCWWCRWACWGP